MFLYGWTTFLSAFLLFQVEMILAKFLLPWFGGGASIWTACVLFFQLLLTLGYAYSHGLVARLSPQRQAGTHLALLAASVGVLVWHWLSWPAPILPGAVWRPGGVGFPTVRILLVLSVAVGLPFFALSATSSLLQAWFARQRTVASPYRLYAVSNAGSMLGLLSYPFLVEPNLSLRLQGWLWTAGFFVFAGSCAWCAWRGRQDRAAAPGPVGTGEAVGGGAVPAPGWRRCLLWAFLAFGPSMLFLATTNITSEEITIVPFLWTVPLAVYLLSFILCFGSRRWYRRTLFVSGGMAAMMMVACARFNRTDFDNILLLVAVYNFALFVCCMIGHGELAALKPAPRHLTLYYYMIAIGGALGGLFVGVVAPSLFDRFVELDAGYLAAAVALVAVMGLDRGSAFHGRRAFAARWCAWAVLPTLVVAIGFLHAYESRGKFHPVFRVLSAWTGIGKRLGNQTDEVRIVAVRRNFYGRVRVADWFFDDPANYARLLYHGRTTHGYQAMGPGKRRMVTAYYAGKSGVAMAVSHMRRAAMEEGRDGLRIGVLGLGTGTMAAFGQKEDTVRFYEINPAVIALSTGPAPLFTFLADCPGKVEIVEGDGRLSLEKEPAQELDLLVVDAFNGDSPPLHLMTREAFAVYRRHLKPAGVLAVNISNRYLNFEPVVWRLAEAYGMRCALVRRRKEAPGYPSVWMLLSSEGDLRNDENLSRVAEYVPRGRLYRTLRLWTDDYSNLFQLLRRKEVSR